MTQDISIDDKDFEAFNFSVSGERKDTIVRPIPKSEYDPKGWSKLVDPEDIEKVDPVYSIQRQPDGFKLFENDSRINGKHVLTAKTPTSFFSTVSRLQLENDNQEYELRRPLSAWPGSNSRAFLFDDIRYEWRINFSSAKLLNVNNEELIAEFYNHAFKMNSEGNLIIYDKTEMSLTFKLLLISTCYEMYLESYELFMESRRRQKAASG